MKMEIRQARMRHIAEAGLTEKVMRLIAEGNGANTIRIETGLPLRFINAAFVTAELPAEAPELSDFNNVASRHHY